MTLPALASLPAPLQLRPALETAFGLERSARLNGLSRLARRHGRGPLLWVLRSQNIEENAQALRHLAAAESSGLFNQDADSVDGQPTDEIPLKKDGVLSHRAGMDTLQRAAKPIWDKAESYVQTKLRCHCFLCSSLLRRYGDAGIRTSIQAHFDEYAFATAIVSLDKLSDFSGGLVVQAQPAEHSRRLVELDLGDLVLHSYDLLHSVDVQGGTRHSLIMWFSTSRAACHKAQTPWKRKYARLGEPNAQYQYARSLIFNSGEAAQGWRWLAQAASKGQSTAQLNWGLRQMQEGRRARAQHWWRRAARQGVKEAAHNLGLSFLESGSFKSALRWLRRAAHMGDADAEALLGGCLDFHPPCVA